MEKFNKTHFQVTPQPKAMKPNQGLTHITELSDENQTITIKQTKQKNTSLFPDSHSSNTSLVKRALNCIYLMYGRVRRKWGNGNDIKIEESQVSQIISRLRRRKPGHYDLLPPCADKQRKTLVLDLDETLIFTSLEKPEHYDFVIDMEVEGVIVKGHVIKRFGVDSFLFQMSKLYEIVVFSSRKRKYVDQILESIDPKHRISYSLTREQCTIINQMYFLKPIRHLGREVKKIIVVDHCRISAALNPESLYQIDPFRGSPKDRKLLKLSHFLKYIHPLEDMQPVGHMRKHFQSKQIKICTKADQKTLRKCHERRNSEVKELLKDQEETSTESMMVK